MSNLKLIRIEVTENSKLCNWFCDRYISFVSTSNSKLKKKNAVLPNIISEARDSQVRNGEASTVRIHTEEVKRAVMGG